MAKAKKPIRKKKPSGIAAEGQPLRALDKQHKPKTVASRRIVGAQRAQQKRQQKRRDSR